MTHFQEISFDGETQTKCNFYVLGIKITIPGLQTKIAKIYSINDQAQKFANNSETIAFITATNPFLTNQAG